MTSSDVSRTIAGIVVSPASWVARHRRSPITSSYVVIGQPPNDDRLQQPDLLHRVHQLRHRVLVEDTPRLLRVRRDLPDVDLRELRPRHTQQAQAQPAPAAPPESSSTYSPSISRSRCRRAGNQRTESTSESGIHRRSLSPKVNFHPTTPPPRPLTPPAQATSTPQHQLRHGSRSPTTPTDQAPLPPPPPRTDAPRQAGSAAPYRPAHPPVSRGTQLPSLPLLTCSPTPAPTNATATGLDTSATSSHPPRPPKAATPNRHRFRATLTRQSPAVSRGTRPAVLAPLSPQPSPSQVKPTPHSRAH